MKKIFLLSILLFQLTFTFGQTPIAEDEKVIQYNTKWGEWISAAGNPNILFSAKLNSYDKQKKLYSWSIRKKVLKMPVAFEWKITNQVFTGASDFNEAVEENDGYYKTSIFDSKSNTSNINGSGFAIYSTSKTTLYYQVRNVCYEFEGREPNCEIKKETSNTKNNNQTPNQTNKNNPLSSLSVIQLEKIIFANLKQNLKTGTFYVHNHNVRDFVNGDIWEITVMEKNEAGTSIEPHTFWIKYRGYTTSNTYFIDKFINIDVDISSKNGQKLLHFIDKANISNEIIKNDIMFPYNFGQNDENFIELKNAFEALNPNKSFGVSSKQIGNVQKTEIVNKNVTSVNNTLTKLNNSLDATNKDFNIIKQNLNNYLKSKGLSVISSNENYGYKNYFFNDKKSIVLTEEPDKNIFTLGFSGDDVNLGEEINNEIQSQLSYGHLSKHHGTNYYITIDLNNITKFNYLSDNFKINSPANFTVMDIYPRTTKIQWTSFPNATGYEIVLQAASENFNDWNTKAFQTRQIVSTSQNNFAFEGVGAQVHRFRVVAKKGIQIIAETEWNYINYKR